MAKNDEHRWELRGEQWVYLAPGEDEPQGPGVQRNESIPTGGTQEEPKAQKADKA